MAGTTDFVPFATGTGANVTSQADYIAESTTTTGFESGVANSDDCNKVWRQATFQAAVLANFVANTLDINVPDDGNLTNGVTNLESALESIASTEATSVVNSALGALTLPFTKITGEIANSQVPQSAVTQYQGNLSIAGGQITSTVGSATDLAGGAAGSIPYQSGASITAFLAAGTLGQVLTQGVGAPTWTTFTGGTGINYSSGTITNTGVTSLSGTANEIAVSVATGSVTLSLSKNVVIPTPSSGNALAVTAASGGDGIYVTTQSASPALVAQGPAATQLTAFYMAQVDQPYWEIYQPASSGDFRIFGSSNGDALRISDAGNFTILAPSSGTPLTVNSVGGGAAIGLIGASGEYCQLTLEDGQTGNVVWQIINGYNNGPDAGVFSIYNTVHGSALAINTNGNVSINAPASGVGLTVNGTEGTWAQQISGNSVSGGSYGLLVESGTTASDYALYVVNQANSVAYLAIFGDGHGFLGHSDAFTWTAANNFALAAPSSGITLQVSGAAGAYTHNIIAPNTANQSYGLAISAGTSSSDAAIYVSNAAASLGLFTLYGNGTFVLGLNASNNNLVTTSGTTFEVNVGSSATGVAAGLFANGADITTYRAGGATGLVYLSSSGEEYVYWNGGGYVMPTGPLYLGGNGDVYLNSNGGTFSYASHFLAGMVNGYVGLTLDDNDYYPTFMAADGGSFGIYCQGNDVWPLQFSGTSSATFSGAVSAPSFNATSDLTLKTDVALISDALDKVAVLNGVTYAWKKDGVESAGLIAQDVEKVLPQLVTPHPRDGTKHLNYNGVIGLLVEAVKALTAQLSEMRIELNSLKEASQWP